MEKGTTTEKKNPSIKEILENYQKDKKSVKVTNISDFNFKRSGGVQYNIMEQIRKVGTSHYKIYQYYSKTDNLVDGYVKAGALNKACENAKGDKDKYMFTSIKVGKEEITVIKRFDVSEDIDPDIITPTRFSYILTLAAIKVYDRLNGMTNEQAAVKTMQTLHKEAINPLAITHGFLPAIKPRYRGDPSWRLMEYYLTTTSGFDALVCVRPAKALAIVAYRSYGRNPVEIGLTSGLDVDTKDWKLDDINENFPKELEERIVQGVYTKVFEWEGKSVKLEEIMGDEGFIDACTAYTAFLVKHAKPTRARAMRVGKVFKEFMPEVRKALPKLLKEEGELDDEFDELQTILDDIDQVGQQLAQLEKTPDKRTKAYKESKKKLEEELEKLKEQHKEEEEKLLKKRDELIATRRQAAIKKREAAATKAVSQSPSSKEGAGGVEIQTKSQAAKSSSKETTNEPVETTPKESDVQMDSKGNYIRATLEGDTPRAIRESYKVWYNQGMKGIKIKKQEKLAASARILINNGLKKMNDHFGDSPQLLGDNANLGECTLKIEELSSMLYDFIDSLIMEGPGNIKGDVLGVVNGIIGILQKLLWTAKDDEMLRFMEETISVGKYVGEAGKLDKEQEIRARKAIVEDLKEKIGIYKRLCIPRLMGEFTIAEGLKDKMVGDTDNRMGEALKDLQKILLERSEESKAAADNEAINRATEESEESDIDELPEDETKEDDQEAQKPDAADGEGEIDGMSTSSKISLPPKEL